MNTLKIAVPALLAGLLLTQLIAGFQAWGSAQRLSSSVIAPVPDNVRYNPYPVSAPFNGIYAHAVATQGAGTFLHISGQVGVDPKGHLPLDFAGQCRQAIRNVEAALRASGMDLSHVVQMRYYLVDRSDMEDLVNVRTALLDGLSPAVTTFIVAGLVDEKWRIEIEALAFKPATSMVRTTK